MAPADGTYAEAIRDAIRWHDANPEWQNAWQELDKKWGFLPNGERGIPEVWKAPLHDRYRTTLNLPDKDLKISALASETADYGRKIAR